MHGVVHRLSARQDRSRSTRKRLLDRGVIAYVLDGDNIRHGLNKNLDFPRTVPRISGDGEVAKLFADAGVVVQQLHQPHARDRRRAQLHVDAGPPCRGFVDTPLGDLRAARPKARKKARAGQLWLYRNRRPLRGAS